MKAPYLIIGLVLLALLLYLVFNTTATPGVNVNDNRSTDTQTDNQDDDTDTSTDTNSKVVTFSIPAQNNSGQSGSATLTEIGGKTQVVVTTTGGPTGVAQPAHIHTGACPNVGGIKYSLNNVVNGTSTTTVDATLEAIRTSLPLGLNIHKSADESNVYVACGDVKF